MRQPRIKNKVQPVDKSVVKLWKEPPSQRNYWLLATFVQMSARTLLGRLHERCSEVK